VVGKKVGLWKYIEPHILLVYPTANEYCAVRHLLHHDVEPFAKQKYQTLGSKRGRTSRVCLHIDSFLQKRHWQAANIGTATVKQRVSKTDLLKWGKPPTGMVTFIIDVTFVENKSGIGMCLRDDQETLFEQKLQFIRLLQMSRKERQLDFE